MATAAEPTTSATLRSSEQSVALASQLRKLARVATVIAVLTSPAAYFWFRHSAHLGVWQSVAASFGVVVGFRGLVDLVIRRLIPWPSLFGTEETRLREEDVVNRRRAWTWRFWYRIGIFLAAIITIFWLAHLGHVGHRSWPGTATWMLTKIGHLFTNKGFWLQLIFVMFLFLANFFIFMGPLMLMGISQIRGYEPGDAEWGVKLDHVRGQAEAKEEVRRIVTLWQSGEAFERAGGKRERGLLFLGAPGTGKTMLAKAIATGFNSPFVSIPGSGFAQTFIGIDALIVRYLARKAKKLARKWGGQCIVFIDEIDAVGMRRQALGGGGGSSTPPVLEPTFYGEWGALNPSGDIIVESREWRDYLFNLRAPERTSPYPAWAQRVGNIMNQGAFPGMFGGMGQLALNQLLVTMDGIDNPPFLRRLFTNKLNTLLDAIYIIPRRLGRVSLRLPPPRPLNAQIYFIGATNVPFENLDPALTRPGRMGRHVWFRTPTKDDRKDIFDLYLDRVAHEPGLDTDKRRDEIARITNGYSPAMIEQICSMALTNAHHEDKDAFEWQHLLDAMTAIEAGIAVGFQYTPDEARQVAIHESGHAVAAHIYRPNVESSRISIKRRGRTGGHHQSFEREERFVHFQSEVFGDLIHGLGAMAAEHVFYGENTEGVGGDLQGTTNQATIMVGAAGMAPQRLELNGGRFDGETEEETRQIIAKRFEEIGSRLINRTRGGGGFQNDPLGAVLSDPHKRALAAQLLGEAFVTAYNAIQHNRAATERVADAVLDQREIFGDDLIQLLDEQKLEKPQIDWTKEESWPRM